MKGYWLIMCHQEFRINRKGEVFNHKVQVIEPLTEAPRLGRIDKEEKF